MSYNFDTDQNHYYFNNKNSLPIIFIHGVGLNQQMWKPQIEFFKDNSFITYDLLGHGKTPFKEPNLSMENFTDQLSNLVNNLKIEKFNLIGFSIGSLIAIEFASKYENYLNSLTLISTTYQRTAEERQNVIDRVGAGDAVLAATAPLVSIETNWTIVGLIANLVGAEIVADMGNRNTLESANLITGTTNPSGTPTATPI